MVHFHIVNAKTCTTILYCLANFKKVLAINIIPRNLVGSQSQASPSGLLYQLILHN